MGAPGVTGYFYSHSIVSGAYKQLKVRDFLSAYAGLTIKSTARRFRLETIEGDRCGTTSSSLSIYSRSLSVHLHCRFTASLHVPTEPPTGVQPAHPAL